MSTKTAKRFRVATSGPTIDGREIKADWLTQAAANYDPQVYGARINVEHMRGYAADSAFGAFGDVTALSTETLKDGRVALYADLLPNDRAIAANKAGQKVYTSIEVIENFAGTGQAYVVGIALTDTPASLGTQRLSFSAQQVAEDASYTAKPFTGLGAKAGAIAFGMAAPQELEFKEDEDQKQEDATSAIQQTFAALRDKFNARFRAGDKATAGLAKEVADTIEAFAEETEELLAQQATATAQLGTDLQAAQAAHNKLAEDFAALKQQLSATPAGGNGRPASTGGTSATQGALTEF